MDCCSNKFNFKLHLLEEAGLLCPHVEPLSHGHTHEMDEAIFGAAQISLWFWRCLFNTNQYWIPIYPNFHMVLQWFYVAHLWLICGCTQPQLRSISGSTHFLCEHEAINQFSVIRSGSQPDQCGRGGSAGARETWAVFWKTIKAQD